MIDPSEVLRTPEPSVTHCLPVDLLPMRLIVECRRKMTQEPNSPAAAFSRKGENHDENMSDDDSEEWDIDASGATVPEDSPHHPDNKSEAVEKAKQRYKVSRPDPQDAENVPDHECDDPDAPWM